jgi:prolyl-tRNA editing enzyme YbaK/EbsC (Cys-tRNA(Pro) deacylase)
MEGEASPAVHDLANYDLMDGLSTSRHRFRLVKKLFRNLLRRKSSKPADLRRSSEGHQTMTKPSVVYAGDHDSDCDTIATSSDSVNSHSTLEGFIVTTSGGSPDDPTEQAFPLTESDPSESNVFEFLLDHWNSYDLEKIEMSKNHDLVFDDATACTDLSETSSLSSCWPKTESNGGRSLMEERLLGTGKVTRDDFDFVPDYVSKEVLHLNEEKKIGDDKPTQEVNVSHVKTGIWEVTSFEDDGCPKKPYYIVTGVSMDDRVDTKKLRKYVFAGQQHRRRPKIDMAPTEVAEGLAGYRSGTMAPICHTQNMRLFLEESLLKGVDMELHRLNVGSGMFGKCLSISAKSFLEIAAVNPTGLQICPIIQTAKK